LLFPPISNLILQGDLTFGLTAAFVPLYLLNVISAMNGTPARRARKQNPQRKQMQKPDSS